MCVATRTLGNIREGQCRSPGTATIRCRVVSRRSIIRGSARPVWTPRYGQRAEIVDKLYTLLLNMEEAELAALTDHRQSETSEGTGRGGSRAEEADEVLASGIVESGRRPDAADGATKTDQGGW